MTKERLTADDIRSIPPRTEITWILESARALDNARLLVYNYGRRLGRTFKVKTNLETLKITVRRV